ncbi:MAG: hypothetical protein LBR98_06275 [Syntrophomonadaceae bacterium]|jgi:hypothetical protein|nr:hypothetical protein [Syntrophomonadaceae bacterium]
MLRKFFLIAVIMFITLSAIACGDTANTGSPPADTVNDNDGVTETVIPVIQNENVQGIIGATYATQWFEFTVAYINLPSRYAGYTPADGKILVDVFMKEKGLFEEPVLMGTFDFYMDSSTFEEYVYPLDPIDDSMMPLEFYLAKDQTAEYHMIYEIPGDTSDLQLMYTELNAEEQEGATFTVSLHL